MKTIRIGTFETNSSSTHTLVMLSKSEYEKFKAGEIFYTYGSERFVTREQVEAEAKKEGIEDLEDFVSDSDYKSFDSFGEGYEDFYQEYTTPNGETVVAIGYYGMDN